MIAAVFISIGFVLMTLYLHQTAFSVLAKSIQKSAEKSAEKSAARLYLVMLGIFAVHLLEIMLYAVGYYLAADVLGIGSLEGERAAGPLGHLYASAVFYTSLGLGDVLPNGHLRFLTVVETLNGLLLIAWSASFIFTLMGRYGPDLMTNEENRSG